MAKSRCQEAKRLLDAVHTGLIEAKKKLVVIVTLGSPSKYDDAVAPWSDTLIRLSTLRGGTTRVELLRHPTKKPDNAEFSMSQLLFHPDSPLDFAR